MAYRVGYNVTPKQLVEQLYDFLTNLAFVEEIDKLFADEERAEIYINHVEKTAQEQTITVSFDSYDGQNKATFNVESNLYGALGTAIEGEPFEIPGQCSFTIKELDNPNYQNGDKFVFKIKGAVEIPFEETIKYDHKVLSFKTKKGKIGQPADSTKVFLGVNTQELNGEETNYFYPLYGDLLDKHYYFITETEEDYNNSPENIFSFSLWIKDFYPYQLVNTCGFLSGEHNYSEFLIDRTLDTRGLNFYLYAGYFYFKNNSYLFNNDYHTIYNPSAWNLIVIQADTANGTLKVYLNDAHLILNESIDTETIKFNITKWLNVPATIAVPCQWNTLLTEQDIEDLYAGYIDITNDNRVYEYILSDEIQTIDSFIVKNYLSNQNLPFYIKVDPVPLNESYFDKPIIHIDSGTHYISSSLATGTNKMIYDEIGALETLTINNKLTKKLNYATFENYTNSGLLLKSWTDLIDKYWFVSDGTFLIVVIRYFKSDDASYRYQLIYTGTVNHSGYTPYIVTTQSSYTGQDSWDTNDSTFNFYSSKNSLYGWLDSPNKYPLNVFDKDPNNVLPYLNNEEINNNYEILPVLGSYKATDNFIYFNYKNLLFIRSNNINAEDFIYINGIKHLVVNDGTNEDFKLLIQLEH